MRKITPLVMALALVIAACGDDDDAAPTTTEAETTTTAPEAPTTTEAVTTTVPETTTTTEGVAALPEDLCERIDVAAVQEALGVDDLRAGSPFGITGMGTSAICRFGVTYSGTFGTGFNLVVYGPAFDVPFGFDDAYDLSLDRMDASGVTDVEGIGVRAAFFIAAAFNDSTVMVVEYEGGWVVEAYADNDNAYGANPPDEVLRTVIDDLVAPTLVG